MKLNLLPSHVAKSQGSKGMFVFGLLILLACGFGAFMLIGIGNTAVDDAKERVAEHEPGVKRAMGKSQMADTVMRKATGLDRNLKLTAAMVAHNTVYIDLYRDVMAVVPDFYRINSLSAAVTGADTCTVNMTGVLLSSQDYMDVVAAFYRMPGVTSVARSGFVDNRKIVPGLDIDDQIGTEIPPGQPNIPSDPEERLDDLVSRAAGPSSGFAGTTFGTEASPKGAMPGWSTVAITLQLTNRAIRPPNPRATIDQHTGSGAGAGRPGTGGIAGSGGGGF